MKSISLCFLLILTTPCFAQHITTIAGTGSSGYSGDGGPATNAALSHPFGVACDGSGNVCFADRTNNRLRWISAAGVITTIAGTDSAGYNGEGLAATDAKLNDPVGVAIDAVGVVYIADKGNNRLRMITPATSRLITVAGNGMPGYSGDGGAATAAQLSQPRAVVIDAAGDMYIADQGNNRIRKVVAGTGIITTMVGTGVAGYSGDGGPATAAQLNGPYGLAIDAANNLYICDVDNQRIRKVTPAGIITTVAGNGTAGYSGDWGPATNAQLNEPIGVAIDAEGGILIADGWNNRMRKVAPTGIIHTIAGTGTAGYSGDGGAAISAELNNPYGVCVLPNGNVVVSDYSNNRLRMLYPGSVGVGNIGKADVSIYPNPAIGGHFTIDAPAGAAIHVYDVTGRSVECRDGNTNTFTLPVYGIYIVEVSTINGRYRNTVIFKCQ